MRVCTPQRVRELGTRAIRVGLILVLSGIAVPAIAQTINPQLIEFVPSPQHWSVFPDGTPVVQGYELDFYLSGATVPFQTMDLGKPGLQADGMVRYDFGDHLAAWPYPDLTCEGHVAAYGLGGSSPAAVSNPFVYSADFFSTSPPPSPPSNIAPTVTLTGPVDGSAFSVNATVALTATAGDADGTVSRVEFYVGSALVGTSLVSPYQSTWKPTKAGTYVVTATAVDNLGARTTSNTATVAIKRKKR